MSKINNTAAAKTTLLETVKAYPAVIVSWCKGFKLPTISAPSYRATVAATCLTAVVMVGLYLSAVVGVFATTADGTVATLQNAVASGSTVSIGDGGITITPTASGPTIGQRFAAAGSVLHSWTVQPVVNADGAMKSRVSGMFSSAPVVQ
jgi:hypothetical protein